MENKNKKQNRIIFLVAVSIILLGEIYLYLYIKKVEMSFQLPTSSQLEKSSRQTAPKITLPKVLYNLAGVVKNYDKQSIALEATIPQLDENGQPAPRVELRKALISPTTKFSSLSFIAQEGANRQTPVESPITFKEIKVGDYIEVISNQDIYQSPEFAATQVRILPR